MVRVTLQPVLESGLVMGDDTTLGNAHWQCSRCWACDTTRVFLGGAQMQKEIEAGRWRGQDKAGDRDSGAAAGPAAKPVPKPYLSAQYREDTMRTTGRPVCRLLSFGTGQREPLPAVICLPCGCGSDAAAGR